MISPCDSGSREEWRPCPDFAGLYEVSSFGRVRSLHRRNSLRILYQGSDETGYPTVALNRHGTRTTRTVHRLVCRAFHGEPNPLHRETAHLDGDKANARADNLKWVSKRENESHKSAHGTRLRGEASPCARISEKQARRVKQLVREGSGVTLAAKIARVTYRTARDIAEGKRWKHVQ